MPGGGFSGSFAKGGLTDCMTPWPARRLLKGLLDPAKNSEDRRFSEDLSAKFLAWLRGLRQGSGGLPLRGGAQGSGSHASTGGAPARAHCARKQSSELGVLSDPWEFSAAC